MPGIQWMSSERLYVVGRLYGVTTFIRQVIFERGVFPENAEAMQRPSTTCTAPLFLTNSKRPAGATLEADLRAV